MIALQGGAIAGCSCQHRRSWKAPVHCGSTCDTRENLADRQKTHAYSPSSKATSQGSSTVMAPSRGSFFLYESIVSVGSPYVTDLGRLLHAYQVANARVPGSRRELDIDVRQSGRSASGRKDGRRTRFQRQLLRVTNMRNRPVADGRASRKQPLANALTIQGNWRATTATGRKTHVSGTSALTAGLGGAIGPTLAVPLT